MEEDVREIKFRAWNKKTNKMIDLQAVTPLALTIKGLFIPFNDEWPLMQYIGLKDKNGKEIYEGDLVNIRNWGRTDEVLHKATIVWDQQTASWQFDPWFDVDEYDRWRNIEITGNIYEDKG